MDYHVVCLVDALGGNVVSVHVGEGLHYLQEGLLQSHVVATARLGDFTIDAYVGHASDGRSEEKGCQGKSGRRKREGRARDARAYDGVYRLRTSLYRGDTAVNRGIGDPPWRIR